MKPSVVRVSSLLVLILLFWAAMGCAAGEQTCFQLYDRENETVLLEVSVQPGDVLRVKGKGIPYLNGRGTGDLLLKIVVEVPKGLNSEQKKLLQEFEATTGEKNYQKRRSFFEKLKRGF